MLIVQVAKPLADPSVDALLRSMADLICQMAPRCGVLVPPAILAYATEDNLPAEVACYALADGTGLLPHDPAILAAHPEYTERPGLDGPIAPGLTAVGATLGAGVQVQAKV